MKLMNSKSPDICGRKREKLALPSRGSDPFLSRKPIPNGVAIGRVCSNLSEGLESLAGATRFDSEVIFQLRRFGEDNLRFADRERLQALSYPQAIKKWSVERMSGLDLPYDMKNRIKPGELEVKDCGASVEKLLFLAEDFLQIASFCRDLQEMQIEMSPHAAGAEYLFEYMGVWKSDGMEAIEDDGLGLLFRSCSKDNSMRLRTNVSSEFIELQIVVFKKQLRLGMSPEDE